MDKTQQIRERIAADGPLTFDLFMDEALYGPGGFFDDPPIGPQRDFVTSPHVHPIFGQLLGIAIEGLWSVLGEPTPLNLVEFGAGDGTLAQQLFAALPGIPVRYQAAERGGGSKKILEELGLEVTDGYEEGLASCRGIFVANELIDNLPFRLLRGKRDGAVELLVDWDDDAERFVKVERPVPIELSSIAPPIDDGEELAVSVEALSFIDRLSGLILDGYAILIDYGGSGGFEPHGYRDQRLVEDILQAPGTSDITAGVDFDSLVRRAKELRFDVFGPVSQHDALMQLGFARWAHSDREHQSSLLDQGEGVAAVERWSDRNAANLLVDPLGLGRLRWLVLGSPDSPCPPWTLPLDTSPVRASL